MTLKQTKYTWAKYQPWAELILYWFITQGGIYFVESQQLATEKAADMGIPLLVTLIYSGTIILFNNRRNWNPFICAGLLFLAWLFHAILDAVVLLLLCLWMKICSVGPIDHIDRLTSMLAGIPILLFAMWNSKYAIKAQENQPTEKTDEITKS